MYPENPGETRIIVGSVNMHGIWYLSDTSRIRTRSLFRHKLAPIHLGHRDGHYRYTDHVVLFQEFDECSTDKHGCHHLCVNTLGGYKCTCSIGYELHSDGKKCEGRQEVQRNCRCKQAWTHSYPAQFFFNILYIHTHTFEARWTLAFI